MQELDGKLREAYGKMNGQADLIHQAATASWVQRVVGGPQ